MINHIVNLHDIGRKKSFKYKKHYKHSFLYKLRSKYYDKYRMIFTRYMVIFGYYDKYTNKKYCLYIIKQIEDTLVEVYDYLISECTYYISILDAKRYVLRNINYSIKRIEYSFLI